MQIYVISFKTIGFRSRSSLEYTSKISISRGIIGKIEIVGYGQQLIQILFIRMYFHIDALLT